MVTRKTLEKTGCTQDRLREIFTARAGTEDYKIAESLRETMRSRIQEGVEFGAQNYKLALAADMAWDAPPISKEVVPLLLYAQGKLDVQTCSQALKGSKLGKECVELDDKSNVVSINMPRLTEVSFNLVRSYVTRRHAAQVIRYSDLYPFLKYEARGTNGVARLKAEVMSQRMQVMVEQFGHKHLHDQAIRDMFLYAEAVIFPASSWKEEESSYLDENHKVASYTSKEGVELVMPHPTMRFADRTRPLAGLNTDTGPCYIGYWDVVPYREIKGNGDYYNTDKVSYGSGLWGVVSQYRDYFMAVRPSALKNVPNRIGSIDSVARSNNRKETIGMYDGDCKDAACFVSVYFVKVNPNNLGIARYAHDVWLRIVAASDDTVIFAEFMPSIPAFYGGVNVNDSRAVNISYAHEIMPYQDQLTNILSQMLMNMKQSLVQFWLANEDLLSVEQKNHLKAAVKSPGYYIHPQLLLYEGEKLREMGIEAKDVLTIVTAQMASTVNDAIKAIGQLLSIVDQLLILSPQEKGQAAPREISATETNVINNSTNAMYSFIGEGIDEMREGMKKLLAEHYLACSESDFLVPVTHRYEAATLEEAGLKQDNSGPMDVSGMLVSGNAASLMPRDMIHEFVYTSRDGVDRMSNAQGAQSLTQLVGNLQNIPGALEVINRSDFFGLINHIVRLTGVYDFKIEVPPGQDGPVAPPQGGAMPVASQSGAGDGAGSANVQAIAELQSQVAALAAQLARVAPPQEQVQPVMGL